MCLAGHETPLAHGAKRIEVETFGPPYACNHRRLSLENRIPLLCCKCQRHQVHLARWPFAQYRSTHCQTPRTGIREGCAHSKTFLIVGKTLFLQRSQHRRRGSSLPPCFGNCASVLQLWRKLPLRHKRASLFMSKLGRTNKQGPPASSWCKLACASVDWCGLSCRKPEKEMENAGTAHHSQHGQDKTLQSSRICQERSRTLGYGVGHCVPYQLVLLFGHFALHGSGPGKSSVCTAPAAIHSSKFCRFEAIARIPGAAFIKLLDEWVRLRVG